MKSECAKKIKDVQRKITEKNKTCKMLGEKFVLLVKEAEKKKDINLVVQCNALKRKTEETEVERRKLKESLKVLIEKKKKF